MPQDPLTQLLAQRAMSQGQPDQSLPDTLSPDQQAAQAQAPLAGLRKPFENGMDYLLSTLGVRGQRPGNLPTALGAGTAAMLGGPKMPFGSLKGVGSAEEATSPLLREIFAKNPAAAGIYNKAMQAQLPEVLAGRQANAAARYATQANAHDALLDLEHAGRPRPIPTDTGFATAIPLHTESVSAKIPYLSRQASMIQTKLGNAGLTEDMIRDIRSLGVEMAARKYKDLPYETVRSIASGGTWNSIR